MSKLREAIQSVVNTIVLTSKDMSANGMDAWIYGVLVGWNDGSVIELKRKFKWPDSEMMRFINYNDSVKAFLDSKSYEKKLWDAINEYVIACGGDPSEKILVKKEWML